MSNDFGKQKRSYYKEAREASDSGEEEEAKLLEEQKMKKFKEVKMFDESEEENEDGDNILDNKNEFDREEDGNLVVNELEDKEEFVQLLKNLKVNLDEVNNNVTPLIQRIKEDKIDLKNGLSYLEAKNNMLLIYSVYLTYYALLKSQGKTINSHPVIKKLIYSKFLIEKAKNIDTKLKPQIDKLIKLAESAVEEEENEISNGKKTKSKNGKNDNVYRPQLLDDGEEDEENDEEDFEEDLNEKSKAKAKKKAKILEQYKPDTNYFDFGETKTEDKKRKQKIEKLKKKIRNSDMIDEYRRNNTDNPVEFKSETTRLDKYMKEVEDYENDNLIRLRLSKKELKKIKRQDAKDDSVYRKDNEYMMLNDLLKEKNSEEVIKHKKLEEKKRSMKDQLKTYLDRKKHRDTSNPEGFEDRRTKQKQEILSKNYKDIESEIHSEFYSNNKDRMSKLGEKANELKQNKKQQTQREIEEKEELGTRKANEMVLKSKGITRKRKDNQGNAKVHLREKYEKKIKQRKNLVKEFSQKPDYYGGETTGIRTHLVRGQKLS